MLTNLGRWFNGMCSEDRRQRQPCAARHTLCARTAHCNVCHLVCSCLNGRAPFWRPPAVLAGERHRRLADACQSRVRGARGRRPCQNQDKRTGTQGVLYPGAAGNVHRCVSLRAARPYQQRLYIVQVTVDKPQQRHLHTRY
jgi:hypothetical protein